jgi:hypothetical protein
MIGLIVSFDRIDDDRMITISPTHVAASARSLSSRPRLKQGPHPPEAKTQTCAQDFSNRST